jgi:hypothetical protein
MDGYAPPDDDRPPPGAPQLLPLFPIVLVVAWAVRSFEEYPWVATRTAVAIALGAAGLIGIPALHWALDTGRRTLTTLLLLGTVVGAMPLLLMLLSGVIGRLARGGVPHAWRVLEGGAPIPGAGLMPWMTFARAEVPAAAIGALSAAVYWLLFIAPRGRQRRS